MSATPKKGRQRRYRRSPGERYFDACFLPVAALVPISIVGRLSPIDHYLLEWHEEFSLVFALFYAGLSVLAIWRLVQARGDSSAKVIWFPATLFLFLLVWIDYASFQTFAKVRADADSPAGRCFRALGKKVEESRNRLPQITAIAEKAAERYLHGGSIGFPSIGSTLEQELVGRSGGLMGIGFDHPSTSPGKAEEKAQDVVIFCWGCRPEARRSRQASPGQGARPIHHWLRAALFS